MNGLKALAHLGFLTLILYVNTIQERWTVPHSEPNPKCPMTAESWRTVLDIGPMRALLGSSKAVSPERLFDWWRRRGFTKTHKAVNLDGENDDDTIGYGSADKNEWAEVPTCVP